MTGTVFHRRALFGALAVLSLAGLAIFPPPAHGLSVFIKPDVPTTADFRVSLGATETAGLGMLFVDGTVLRTVALRPSVPATFTAVPLAPGAHLVRVGVRSASGLAFSPLATVRAWAVPATPIVGGLHPGLYPVEAPLKIVTGGSTTRLTGILGGKRVLSKSVSGAASFSQNIHLSPGANVLVIVAGNPVSSARKNVVLDAAVWPAPGHTRVTSEFGPRSGRMHKGIDIPAPYGSAVVAAGAGRVLWARNLTTYGGLVMIDHGNKLTTYYAHLSRIDVKYGQWVRAGQQIGAVGVANVAHLHFQTFAGGLGWNDTTDMYRRVNSGTPVNPRVYVGYP
jgi:murein DD-endopeptidase MepM/ murein hydrolase activator NlpD